MAGSRLPRLPIHWYEPLHRFDKAVPRPHPALQQLRPLPHRSARLPQAAADLRPWRRQAGILSAACPGCFSGAAQVCMYSCMRRTCSSAPLPCHHRPRYCSPSVFFLPAVLEFGASLLFCHLVTYQNPNHCLCCWFYFI